jgi:hypothetical protein
MQREKKAKAYQAWFDEPDISKIERWRREQPVIPSIADAMRTLVKLGLATTESDEKANHA